MPSAIEYGPETRKNARLRKRYEDLANDPRLRKEFDDIMASLAAERESAIPQLIGTFRCPTPECLFTDSSERKVRKHCLEECKDRQASQTMVKLHRQRSSRGFREGSIPCSGASKRATENQLAEDEFVRQKTLPFAWAQEQFPEVLKRHEEFVRKSLHFSIPEDHNPEDHETDEPIVDEDSLFRAINKLYGYDIIDALENQRAFE